MENRIYWFFILVVVRLIQIHGFGSQRYFSPLRRYLSRNGILLKNTPERSDDLGKNGEDMELDQILDFHLHSSISSVEAKAWNSCLDSKSSPFLDHAWLRCLEESKCASAQTGWAPQHLTINIGNELRGFVPMYVKGHSMGEFIFDQSFAEAAYQNRIDYYPKMLVGIPFTPATGRRIQWHPKVYQDFSSEEIRELNRAVGVFLKQLAKDNKLSSVHCNFLTNDEATDLAGPLTIGEKNNKSSNPKDLVKRMLGLNIKDDFLRRTSLQYHWTNSNPKYRGKPFQSFDDYLNCFRSKRRIKIRRERRMVLEDENIRIDAIAGKEILKYDGLVERMFEIYLSTIDKMIWGRQYLTLEFFELLAHSEFIDNLVFMCARRNSTGENFDAGDVFAGTINIVKDGVFYGRYWGCLPEYEVKNLHFETCYWSAIDYCIAHGLHRMEPGAGGGDYKWARGFDPILIHSVHYICNPGLRRAIGEYLRLETEEKVEVAEYLRSRSVIAAKQNAYQ